MLLLSAALAVTPAFASRSHRTATAGPSSHSKAKKKHVSHVIQGQRGIDSDRAAEIQTALIHQNYMSGTPSGQWDDATQAAMQKYQADHGWQTKLTPDSRALIKLGLGPSHTAGAVPTQTAAAESVSAANDNSISTKPEPAGPADSLPSISAANTLADAHSIQN
jgi:hypothetical protein